MRCFEETAEASIAVLHSSPRYVMMYCQCGNLDIHYEAHVVSYRKHFALLRSQNKLKSECADHRMCVDGSLCGHDRPG